MGHLYLLNAVSGLMNTFQQPASDVAVSLLVPREQYHQVSGLRALSNSLVTVLAPILASAVFAFGGLGAVIAVDLATFAVAAAALCLAVRLPHTAAETGPREPIWQVAKAGLAFLAQNEGVLHLILFLAAINLTASMYNAALPALLLPRAGGGEMALGLVNTCAGLANLAGSAAVSLAPAPKSRVRVIVGAVSYTHLDVYKRQSITWRKVGTPPQTARSTTGTPLGMGIPASVIIKHSLWASPAIYPASWALRTPFFFMPSHSFQPGGRGASPFLSNRFFTSLIIAHLADLATVFPQQSRRFQRFWRLGQTQRSPPGQIGAKNEKTARFDRAVSGLGRCRSRRGDLGETGRSASGARPPAKDPLRRAPPAPTCLSLIHI